MTLEQLVKIIDAASELGDAVRDQLRDTVGPNPEPFRKMNPRAILLIIERLFPVIDEIADENDDDELIDDLAQYVYGWDQFNEGADNARAEGPITSKTPKC